jgi:hypothetical protein
MGGVGADGGQADLQAGLPGFQDLLGRLQQGAGQRLGQATEVRAPVMAGHVGFAAPPQPLAVQADHPFVGVG